MAKLRDKQKRFVQEYLVDFNEPQAAIRAGYSKKTAGAIGHENLKKPHILAEIEKRKKALQNKLEITQERVLQELASIAFSKGTDYASVIAGCVVVNDTEGLTEEQKAAIVSIKQTKEGVEIKLADKYKALELLAKHLGLLAERPEAEERLEDDPLTKSIKEAADGFFKEAVGDIGVSEE